jgi:L-rhamnose-H+ transport protein
MGEMMSIIGGSLLCVLGGIGIGSFLLPLKYSKTWRWENSWLVGAFFMYLALPLVTISSVVPRFREIYALTPARDLWMIYLFGIIQGTGSLIFTYGTSLMGISLGYALMIGCIAFFSLLIPLFVAHADRLTKLDGLTLLLGCMILLIGVAMSGRAGLERERLATDTTQKARPARVSTLLMIVVVLWAGIANAMFYFTFEFQQSMKALAIEQFHVPPYAWGFLNTLPFFLGMFTINVLLTGAKMIKDGSMRNYWSAPNLTREYSLALAIGIIWYLSQGIGYTAAQAILGPLGVPVGGGLFMGTIIISSNLFGLYTGEWNGVPANTMRKLHVALITLVAAVSVIALGNYLQIVLRDSNKTSLRPIIREEAHRTRPERCLADCLL